ncbi:hypothetical protein B6K86_04410 [Lachnospiraceae bacterium]|nr:hypothetical protein B6K86_04410 [Lachnospiraceae bacterium]
MGEVLVWLLIAALVVVCIRNIVKNLKNGSCGGCSCDSHTCDGSCKSCSYMTNPEEIPERFRLKK